jgi:hypothetical protein
MWAWTLIPNWLFGDEPARRAHSNSGGMRVISGLPAKLAEWGVLGHVRSLCDGVG